MKALRHVLISLIVLLSAQVSANTESVALQKANLNPYDMASKQRGAAVFMNYCAGCHSLQYLRYDGVAKDLGIVNDKGVVLDAVVKKQLNLVSDKVTDNIVKSMPDKDAGKWFGIAPPDLSLEARVRGTDWIYTYLKSFYIDPTRPWGVNNQVFPSVGMPHVLLELQGPQEGIFEVHEAGHPPVLVGLKQQAAGQLTPEEYDQVVRDLVNFLDYTAEPVKLERQRLGVWVLLFLTIFLVFAYLLKREYWKDVH